MSILTDAPSTTIVRTPCSDDLLLGDPDLDLTLEGAVLEGSAEPLGAVWGGSAGPLDAVLEGSAGPLAAVLTGAEPVTAFRKVSVKPSNDTTEFDAGITDAAYTAIEIGKGPTDFGTSEDTQVRSV